MVSPLIVHIVLACHLDIGFNGQPRPGLDSNAINNYFDTYFLKAASVARELETSGSSERLIFTTHAYLLSLYFDCPEFAGFHCPNETAKEVIRDAIRRGWITWHAFPYNGQMEMFDSSLLQFAVQLVHDLDAEFDLPPKHTLSQRDVPGMTRSALPWLTKLGIDVLSFGVNGGSAPPGVPHNQPFIWRDEQTSSEVLAFWHPGGYSGVPVDSKEECVHAAGMQDVLCMSWKQDNAGPPDANEVRDIFKRVREGFPGAEVKASTFDAYSKKLTEAAPQLDLPVVTGEVGDTWINGVASDPFKMSRYRDLLRLRQGLIDSGFSNSYALQNFSRFLLKVPEHTWGVDIKTDLADMVNFNNTAFRAALAKDEGGHYSTTVEGWTRQAGYLDWAVTALSPAMQTWAAEHTPRWLSAGLSSPLASLQQPQQADPTWKLLLGVHEAELSGKQGPMQRKLQAVKGKSFSQNSQANTIAVPVADASQDAGTEASGVLHDDDQLPWGPELEAMGFTRLSSPRLESDGWDIELDPITGAAVHLQRLEDGNPKGPNWAGKDNPLGHVVYTTYSEQDYELVWREYAYQQPCQIWMKQDFGKPGVDKAGAKHGDFSPTIKESWHRGSQQGHGVQELLLRGVFAEEAHVEAGAPKEVWIRWGLGNREAHLYLDVTWIQKNATRLPEATWVEFNPPADAVDKESWKLSKLDYPVSPLEVVYNGSQSMHVVDERGVSVTAQDSSHRLHVRSLDAPLLSPGNRLPFQQVRAKPDMTQGISYNLHNNIWGTNYIMWSPYGNQEAHHCFRFLIEVEAAAAIGLPS
ncbi:hypothetical protein WJX74_004142 [Apatococcus lobatus]